MRAKTLRELHEISRANEGMSKSSHTILDVQFHNIGEYPNPIIPFLNHGNDDLHGVTERQRASVISRRIGRIRNSALPGLEIRGVPEDDPTEKMFSGARNPRFRYEAAPFERLRLVMKGVDDVIRDFLWEAQV